MHSPSPSSVPEPRAIGLDAFGVRPTPIRELGSSERSLFLRHLLALDTEDRYLRFGSPLSDGAIEA